MSTSTNNSKDSVAKSTEPNMALSTTENIELPKSSNIKKGIKNKTFKMKDKTIAKTKKKADKPSADKTSAEVTKTVETVDHAVEKDVANRPKNGSLRS